MSLAICEPPDARISTGRLPTASFPVETPRPIDADAVTSRLQQLAAGCELLADGFDGLDDQIAEYVGCHPTTGNIAGPADVDRFLKWLEAQPALSDEQEDFVAALRNRQAIELVAVKQRLAHARFQDLHRASTSRIGEVNLHDQHRVHLNPIRSWSQLETHCVSDGDTDFPATVMFVAGSIGVRAVLVEKPVEFLLRMLEHNGPLRVCDLLRRISRSDHNHCLESLRQLANAGVIAFSCDQFTAERPGKSRPRLAKATGYPSALWAEAKAGSLLSAWWSSAFRTGFET